MFNYALQNFYLDDISSNRTAKYNAVVRLRSIYLLSTLLKNLPYVYYETVTINKLSRIFSNFYCTQVVNNLYSVFVTRIDKKIGNWTLNITKSAEPYSINILSKKINQVFKTSDLQAVNKIHISLECYHYTLTQSILPFNISKDTFRRLIITLFHILTNFNTSLLNFASVRQNFVIFSSNLRLLNFVGRYYFKIKNY